MRNALIRNNVVVNVITSAEPRPQDYQAVVDVSNVTPSPESGWAWNGGASFTKVVPAEVTNEQTIRQQADNAFDGNRSFLALASPTNAQTLVQVKALTRQVDGILRLVLGKFDATD